MKSRTDDGGNGDDSLDAFNETAIKVILYIIHKTVSKIGEQQKLRASQRSLYYPLTTSVGLLQVLIQPGITARSVYFTYHNQLTQHIIFFPNF